MQHPHRVPTTVVAGLAARRWPPVTSLSAAASAAVAVAVRCGSRSAASTLPAPRPWPRSFASSGPTSSTASSPSNGATPAGEHPLPPPRVPEPRPNLTPSSAPVIWSVLPQGRGRSVAVDRLWINRYLQRKESARQTAVNQGGILEKPKLLFKNMTDSRVEEFLPFKSDAAVREDYVNAYGSIRIGKILEDLDALAGSIAYVHCDDGSDDTPPLTIVTASLDRIDMISRIPTDVDVSISGFVT
ncbi:hypothetical protein HK405_000428, partial [Cladochytrium tenue]